jgi:hypothetical protein
MVDTQTMTFAQALLRLQAMYADATPLLAFKVPTGTEEVAIIIRIGDGYEVWRVGA